MAFRYDRETVALLLPHMQVSQTEGLVAQLCEAMEPIAVAIIAGIAPAAPATSFEAEDAATEWINRVDRALALAATIPERLCVLEPPPNL